MYVIPKKIKFKQPDLSRVVGFQVKTVESASHVTRSADFTLAEIGSPDPEGYYSVDIDANGLRTPLGVDSHAYAQAVGSEDDGSSGFVGSAPFASTAVPEPPSPPDDVIVVNS